MTFRKTDGSCALTTIGSSAFRLCTSLEEIAIPDSVSTLGENWGWNLDRPDETAAVFYGCLLYTSRCV